jgi:hypothetical protein
LKFKVNDFTLNFKVSEEKHSVQGILIKAVRAPRDVLNTDRRETNLVISKIRMVFYRIYESAPVLAKIRQKIPAVDGSYRRSLPIILYLLAYGIHYQ